MDDDGKAYHIYSSEDNLTLQIAELSDDYLSHSGKYIRIFPGGHNEAPAIFKKNGIYWMITSGCTGWEPNKARLLTATSIWGEWKQLPNPCIGKNADKHLAGKAPTSCLCPGRKIGSYLWQMYGVLKVWLIRDIFGYPFNLMRRAFLLSNGLIGGIPISSVLYNR